MTEPTHRLPRPAPGLRFPADTAEAVTRDRIMLQINPRRLNRIRALLPDLQDRGGLVLSGKNSAEKVAELRDGGEQGVLLADPAGYTKMFATAADPFPVPPDEPVSLVGTLQDAVTVQVGCGASAVLSPTGFIRAEDSAALKAGAAEVTALADPRVIFVVPIDAAWLREEWIRQLIAVLTRVPGRKAVMLGGQWDPLGRFNAGVVNLRRLVAEVPQIALMRADIAAFGAVAYGAEFSAFGMGTSQRHIVPPDQKSKSSGGSSESPSVLFPELMHFCLGEKIATKYAATPGPVCRCAYCLGQDLDRFIDRSTENAAISHNVAVLMGWACQLLDVESGRARQNWWHQRCTTAVNQYTVINTLIRQPDAFTVPKQLAAWAQAPAGNAASVSLAAPQR